MKYTSLKNDVINILHSADSNLDLKFYDENGNITINVDDAIWGYIHDENIIIEFMTDNNPVITLWKNKDNTSDNIKDIIQRIRELAILNGVSVQIRVYNNLDQRKIYNLIKSSIIANKEDKKMNESVNNDALINTLKNIIQTAKNTKKPSDFYMSEEIKNKNYENILKEMFTEIKNLKKLSKVDLTEQFNSLLTVSNYSDLASIINNFSSNTLSVLNESINDISNICKFVKKEYLNNVPFETKKSNTLFVLENVKVYKSDIISPSDNLTKAYNKLISLSENAKTGIDLLKIIKQNKILESYNVSKHDLINVWLSKNNQPIKQKQAFIIENYLGEKIAFNENLAFGIKALAQYINNNGSKDSQICKNIVKETIKYNQISSFIIEYKDNFSVRKYIPEFKNIFKSTINKINSAGVSFDSKLFESIEEQYDYSKQLQKISDEIGISHPALKYLAIEEAKKEFYNNKILNEEKNNDILTLTREFKHYNATPSVVATIIVENHLNIKNLFIESTNNTLDNTTMLYNALQNNTDEISSTVASALFTIIHSNKKLAESKQNFVNTLLKYCKK
jgi:hypothetical protein